MIDRESGAGKGAPTDEEVAAVLAAVRLVLRRQQTPDTGSRWARTGRAEGVASPAGPATWATAERPR